MGNRLHISSPLILLILLALLTFWLDRVTRPSERAGGDDLYVNPDYIVEDISGIRMDHEREIQRKFTAERLFHYLDEEITQMEQVSFINIEPEKPLMRLSADRAEIKSKGKNIYLTGNVTAIRGADDEKSKITLMTDFLQLIPDEDLVKTDRAVTISRMNTTIHSTGLEFNNRVGEIQLLSKVKAVNKK